MKKKVLLFSLFVLSFVLFGCSFNNTPKAKVESLLMKYQKNTDTIMTELNDYMKTLDINETDYEEYKKIYTRQYTDLTYEIKDELIDGDNASVTAQIEVYDYYKTENDAIKYTTENSDEFTVNGVYDAAKVMKYKIDKMNTTKDRVVYTVIFSLRKIDDEWTIEKLSNEDLEKIHGIYAH